MQQSYQAYPQNLPTLISGLLSSYHTARPDSKAWRSSPPTGGNRYLALCHKYGADTVREAMEWVFDQSEALVRRMIAEMPDGEWSAESCLDYDGVVKDKPRRIKVTVRIQGDEMTVDFTGTDETAAGPINIPLTGARAAVEIAFKSVTVPHEPSNAGHSRPLKVVSPENTITNPSWPSPCDSYGYAALVTIDLMSEALSHAVLDRCLQVNTCCSAAGLKLPIRSEPKRWWTEERPGRWDGRKPVCIWPIPPVR